MKFNTTQALGNEEDEGDIIVVGVRERNSNYAENRLAIAPGGSWFQAYQGPTGGWGRCDPLPWRDGFQAYQGPTGGWGDSIPPWFRNLIDSPTTITIGQEFDARHVKLAQDAIRRLASLPQFKAAYDHMQDSNLDVHIHVATRSDHLSSPSDYGSTKGLNRNRTASDGAHVTIYINLNRLGGELADRQFQITVMHEFIHAFGNPQWSEKLDAPGSTWDKEIYSAAFSHQSVGAIGPSPVEATGSAGGRLDATMDGSVLLGSQTNDDIRAAASGNTVFSGAGDDRVEISVHGMSSVRDDGGYDTIVVRDAAGMASLTARWSSDGKDVALYNDGTMIALLAGSGSGGAFEAVQVGASVVSLSSITSQTNTAPVVQDQLLEIRGTHQGLVGDILGHDPDGDKISYQLADISGAYSDRPWRVASDGRVYADFLREDAPGSEFTNMRVIATDGLSSSQMDLTVRWASDTSPNPELRRAYAPSSSDTAVEILESFPYHG